MADHGPGSLEELLAALQSAPRIFVHGAGRSGLALRMVAMRLMHAGLHLHIVGDVTTPALAPGDLLLCASGSGTTASVVGVAGKAVEAGGSVAALTTDPASPLGALASHLVVIPAAAKLERSSVRSHQFAGSLFEQSVLAVGDALFDTLWRRLNVDADALWPRHANLE